MRKRDTSRQGLAAVEFALVLPVMALLLMLLVEGASAMHTYSALVEASREGARHVLIEDGNTASVEALIDALVADLDADDVTSNVVTDPVANTVTVEVSYDYSPFGRSDSEGLFGNNEPIQFVAQTTMPLP